GRAGTPRRSGKESRTGKTAIVASPYAIVLAISRMVRNSARCSEIVAVAGELFVDPFEPPGTRVEGQLCLDPTSCRGRARPRAIPIRRHMLHRRAQGSDVARRY